MSSAQDFEDGLRRARTHALAPCANKALPVAVIWTQGQVHAPESLCSGQKACATLKRAGEGEPPAFALDFGKSSIEGWAVIRVKSAKGNPVLHLAYANYPDPNALREDGDFNEETRAATWGATLNCPFCRQTSTDTSYTPSQAREHS